MKSLFVFRLNAMQPRKSFFRLQGLDHRFPQCFVTCGTILPRGTCFGNGNLAIYPNGKNAIVV